MSGPGLSPLVAPGLFLRRRSSQASPLLTGIRAWYLDPSKLSLSGDARWADSTASGFDLTPNADLPNVLSTGGPSGDYCIQYTSGMNTNSRLFYAMTSNEFDFSPTSSYRTALAWVKLETRVSGHTTLFSAAGVAARVTESASASRVSADFKTSGGSGGRAENSGVTFLDNWHVVGVRFRPAATWDWTTQVDVVVNTSIIPFSADLFEPPAALANPGIGIGTQRAISTSGTRLPARYGVLGVWDRELSPAEISLFINGGIPLKASDIGL
jgi:hypothetical protein